jgi:RecB family exonuclease
MTFETSDRAVLTGTLERALEAAALAHCGQVARRVIVPNVAAGKPWRTRFPRRVHVMTVAQSARQTLEQAGWQSLEPGVASQFITEILAQTPLDFLSSVHNRASTVRTVLATVREFARAGVPSGLAAGIISSGRARDIGQIYAAFLEYLRDKKRYDSSTAEILACTLELETRPTLVSGFAYLDAAQIQYVNAISGPGSLITLPLGPNRAFTESERTVVAFEQLRWRHERLEPDAPKTVGEVSASSFAGLIEPTPMPFASYPTLESEVRGVLGRVRVLLNAGVPSAQIALITRDEPSYLPTLEAVANEYGVGLTSGHAVSLSDTEVGGWVSDLIEANLEGLPYRRVQMLLANPLVTTVRADAAVWSLARRAPRGIEAWLPFTDAPNAVRALEWPVEAPRATFVRAVFDALEGLGVVERARGVAHRAVSVNLLARGLRRLALSDDAVISRAVFSREVTAMLEAHRVPRLLSKAGVRVHTPLAVLGRRFEFVFILGMNEGVFPARSLESPLLDTTERLELRAHGVDLPTLETRGGVERALFRAALERAQTALMLSSATRGTGDLERPPSRFLQAFKCQPPQKVEVLQSRREWRLRQALNGALQATDGDVIAHALRASSVERHRDSSAAPDRFDGVLSAGLPDFLERPWSVSQLHALGACRFRWFARKALDIELLPAPARSLEATVTGTLYHATLEHAARLAKQPEIQWTLEAFKAQLEAGFGQSEAKLEDDLQGSLDWARERKDHLRVLRRAVRAPDFVREDRDLVGVEFEFEPDTASFEYAPGQRVALRGRIDRVDVSAERFEIIDYKTGDHYHKVRVQNALGAPLKLEIQLPLYLAAGLEALGLLGVPELMGLKPSKARYYSLRGAKTLLERGPDASPGARDETWEQHLERTRGFVREALEDVAHGYFPPIPDEQREACALCEFSSVCREHPGRTRAKITAAKLEARATKGTA